MLKALVVRGSSLLRWAKGLAAIGRGASPAAPSARAAEGSTGLDGVSLTERLPGEVVVRRMCGLKTPDLRGFRVRAIAI